ncbi:RPAP3 protein, partial [Polypterus senegalus]
MVHSYSSLQLRRLNPVTTPGININIIKELGLLRRPRYIHRGSDHKVVSMELPFFSPRTKPKRQIHFRNLKNINVDALALDLKLLSTDLTSSSSVDDLVDLYNQYAVAESDCNLAIALDRNYVKAYARRGAARFALKKFEDAKEDYEIVLKLDPENFEAITEIKKIDQAFITKVNKPEHRVQETNIASEMDEIEKKKIELQQAKQQAIVQKDLKMTEIGLLPEECSEQKTEVTQPIIVQPIEKPFHKQSTKPLKRIKIEDVEDELLTNLPLRLNNPIELTLDPAEENITEGESKTLQTDSSSRFLKIEEIPNTEREILESDSTESHIEVHSSANVMRKAPDESIIGNTSLAPCLSVPPVPTNSFQLETDLRKLKDHPDMMYIYLKQIDPAHFPKLFQTSLEPDILNQILKVLHVSYRRHESPSLMLEVLKNLAQVKRFDMAIMFMSKEEKNALVDFRKAFDSVDRALLWDILRDRGIPLRLLDIMAGLYTGTQLRKAEIRYSFLYPAKLKVDIQGKHYIFITTEEAEKELRKLSQTLF